MGCGTSSSSTSSNHSIRKSRKAGPMAPAGTAFKSAVLIQRWYRRYVAQLEVRRRCTWSIFQSIEYTGEQDQIKLYDFFNFLMDHFAPNNSKERDFICRMFTEEENLKDTELEKYCDYETIEVPVSYTGPRLTFPLKPRHAAALVEAFKQKQQLHARYVLHLLHETRKHLKLLPNIKRVTSSYSKEITICGKYFVYNLHASLLEALYRNRSDLETIFRIIDSDSSGLISFEEFKHTWKLLSSHLNIEVSDEAICNLAKSIDFNKDGNIDINEFLEAFRLADRPHFEERESDF
ncbi:hypothetical protein GDO81_000828 [Engystomops pustulosus]|uniref:protein-serine/threonine phosphatase n=1 Tax=Engystomops pustulosus TaxID=76066 RepID=A0AAV7D7L2_ENGPU|nr:hypothetical protein GDO81_000828 [Engystomops pustulosus]